MRERLLCGAAVGDITPDESWLPISQTHAGVNGWRNAKFAGILDPLKLRVLALQSGDRKAMIVTFDSGQIPSDDDEQMLVRLSERTGIPREYILLFATHTHTAPNMAEDKKTLAYIRENHIDVPEFEKKQHAMNSRMLTVLEETVDQAWKNLRPARMGIGYGKSYINANRNVQYADRWNKGLNAEWHSDKTVAVIRFEDDEGKPVAFLVNYAVHAAVMFGNQCFGEDIGISGDIPGLTCAMMEEKFDGAVALWTSGAAGDQNPIFMNTCFYPDPKTGVCVKEAIPNGDYHLLKVLSARHFADILAANDKIRGMTDSLQIFGAEGDSICPGGETIVEEPGNIFSRILRFEDGEDFRIRVKLLVLGSIALYGIGGELYSSIGEYVKEHSPLRHTLVVNHSIKNVKYILDDAALEAGCVAAGEARYKKGYVKEALAHTLEDMLKEACYYFT